MRPDVRLVLRTDQLRCYPHLVSIPPHTSFEQILDAELTPDLIHRLLRVFVVHHGSSRYHPKALWISVAELRNHFLSESVAEVFLRNITCQVFKRQHGKHDLAGGKTMRALLVKTPQPGCSAGGQCNN